MAFSFVQMNDEGKKKALFTSILGNIVFGRRQRSQSLQICCKCYERTKEIPIESQQIDCWFLFVIKCYLLRSCARILSALQLLHFACGYFVAFIISNCIDVLHNKYIYIFSAKRTHNRPKKERFLQRHFVRLCAHFFFF